MASTREKRDNAGDKLKDIIDSLKPKATKQKETHDNNEDSDSESDGEFAESFEKLTEDNDNEEINALENELKRLKTEKRKVEYNEKLKRKRTILKTFNYCQQFSRPLSRWFKILQKVSKIMNFRTLLHVAQRNQAKQCRLLIFFGQSLSLSTKP